MLGLSFSIARIAVAAKRRPYVLLSGPHTQQEGVAVGATIGTLSVAGLIQGVYSFAELADPDNAFTLTGAAVKNGIVFRYATKATHSVSYRATSNNGGDPVIDVTFIIGVRALIPPSGNLAISKSPSTVAVA